MPEIISFSEPMESPRSASLPVEPENVTFFDKFFRVFFGDDIFISYSRVDGLVYGRSLARLLQKKYRLTTFADFRWSEPGETLPAFLIKKLKRSTVLVVIITKGAVERSANIREEIKVFSKTKRPFFVIDLDNAYRSSEWPELAGINPVKDVSAFDGIAPRAAKPSTAILQGIRDSFKYKTQYDKQRFSALAAFLLIVISILTAIVTGFYSARAVKERDMAYAERSLANTERDQANRTKEQALKDAEAINRDLSDTRNRLGQTEGYLAAARTEKQKVESDLVGIKAEKEKAGRELKEKELELKAQETIISQKTGEANYLFSLSEIKRADTFYKNRDMFNFLETLNGVDPEYRETEWQYLNQLTEGSLKFATTENKISGTAFPYDGGYLFTLSDQLLRWDLKTGRSDDFFNRASGNLSGFKLSPDRKLLLCEFSSEPPAIGDLSGPVWNPVPVPVDISAGSSPYSFGFTADGRRLIGARSERKRITVQYWDIRGTGSGLSIEKAEGSKTKAFEDEILSAEVLPDEHFGISFLSKENSYQIKPFDPDFNEIRFKDLENKRFQQILLTKDGKKGVLESKGYPCELFIVDNWAALTKLPEDLLKSENIGTFWSGNDIVLSDDGRLLALEFHDGIRVIDLESKSVVNDIQVTMRASTSFSFSKDGKYLSIVNSNFDGDIDLWKIGEKESFAFEGSACHDCKTTANADGSRLVTADSSGKVILWSPFTGEQLSVLADSPLNEGEIRTAGFFENGGYIYSYDKSSEQGGNSKTRDLRIWNEETGKEISKPEFECETISDLLITGDRSRLFILCGEKIDVWDLNKREHSGEIKTRRGQYLGLVLNEKVITVSGSADYPEYYYDAETGEELQSDDLSTSKTGGKEILSPDGKWLIYEYDRDYFLRSALEKNSPGEDRRLGRVLISGWRIPRHVFDFSPDGRFLLLIMRDGIFKIDLTTFESSNLFSGNPGFIGTVSFSPSSSWGVYMEGPRIEFWDTRIWKRREFPACSSFFDLKTRAFTSDERKFINGCDDGTVRIWDLRSGQEVLNFKAADSKIDELFLSPDERSLLTISDEGSKLSRLKLQDP